MSQLLKSEIKVRERACRPSRPLGVKFVHPALFLRKHETNQVVPSVCVDSVFNPLPHMLCCPNGVCVSDENQYILTVQVAAMFYLD